VPTSAAVVIRWSTKEPSLNKLSVHKFNIGTKSLKNFAYIIIGQFHYWQNSSESLRMVRYRGVIGFLNLNSSDRNTYYFEMMVK
jgi:hypothetical protein